MAKDKEKDKEKDKKKGIFGRIFGGKKEGEVSATPEQISPRTRPRCRRV